MNTTSLINLKFTLRKDSVRKNGMSSLYLNFISNGVRYRERVPVSVFACHWDACLQRVSIADIDSESKNTLLSFYEVNAKTYFLQCHLQKKNVKIEEFRNVLFGAQMPSSCYFTFVRQEIEEDNSLSLQTKRTYSAKLNKLARFSKKINLSDIDYTFLMKYKNWAIAQGSESNTIFKDVAIIKSFLNRAVNKGLIEKHDCDRVKIKTVESTRNYLTQNELQRLRELYNSDDLSRTHRKILQQFLFSCYTGLRYSDLLALSYNHIDLKNNLILMRMHKTQKIVEIPLIEEALKLLPAQTPYSSAPIFQNITNQFFNRNLKEIVAQVGVTKSISHHCARHTFATLAFSCGIKMEIISKILGHSSIKVTLEYAKILQEQKVSAMSQFNAMITG